MGLKTASFSQARQLIVTSAPLDGERATRAWDLDLVKRTEQWRLLQDAGPADARCWTAFGPGTGTIVLWRHLHRFDLPGVTADDVTTQKHFYDEIRRVEAHLGMVFARFLSRQRGSEA